MRLFVLSFVILSLTSPPNARAQQDDASEYEVKAAFLYNFGKFVEWPAGELKANDDLFVIGVLGDDPFDGMLDRLVENKLVQGKRLAVRRFKTVGELTA